MLFKILFKYLEYHIIVRVLFEVIRPYTLATFMAWLILYIFHCSYQIGSQQQKQKAEGEDSDDPLGLPGAKFLYIQLRKVSHNSVLNNLF